MLLPAVMENLSISDHTFLGTSGAGINDNDKRNIVAKVFKSLVKELSFSQIELQTKLNANHALGSYITYTMVPSSMLGAQDPHQCQLFNSTNVRLIY